MVNKMKQHASVEQDVLSCNIIVDTTAVHLSDLLDNQDTCGVVASERAKMDISKPPATNIFTGLLREKKEDRSRGPSHPTHSFSPVGSLTDAAYSTMSRQSMSQHLNVVHLADGSPLRIDQPLPRQCWGR